MKNATDIPVADEQISHLYTRMSPLEALSYAIEESEYNKKDATDDGYLTYYENMQQALTHLEESLIAFIHGDMTAQDLKNCLQDLHG
jgi:hypothetical protein